MGSKIDRIHRSLRMGGGTRNGDGPSRAWRGAEMTAEQDDGHCLTKEARTELIMYRRRNSPLYSLVLL